MTNPKKLIDPSASVIDRTSSTLSIQLIHRCLISHLVFLKSQTWPKSSSGSQQRAHFDLEYNSTSQLANDVGIYLQLREKAEAISIQENQKK